MSKLTFQDLTPCSLFSLFNIKTPNDWSLGKQLILFPLNLKFPEAESGLFYSWILRFKDADDNENVKKNNRF